MGMRLWVSVDRKLTMDENGCTVEFYGFKRYYKWEEFKVKQIIDQRNSLGYDLYDKGVIFCKHKVRRPRWLKISKYCGLVHPWSIVYVNFIPEKKSGWDIEKYSHSMAVDEKEFMACMKEWNIEFVEIAGIFESKTK